MTDATSSDALMAACEAMLREVGGNELGHDRLADSLPIVRNMAAAVRLLDELDLSGVEPMTSFKPLP